jgi:hypothetical protein
MAGNSEPDELSDDELTLWRPQRSRCGRACGRHRSPARDRLIRTLIDELKRGWAQRAGRDRSREGRWNLMMNGGGERGNSSKS